uniref:Endoglucanase C (EgC) (Endo-1,4-beta-glucanase C) (Cellulase C) n=1 Tax=uncultured bacterium contig00078 TaxID=1181556 RepID=A0A806K1T3_9BACT|nr:endoglucanase C (EgC) (endo-1,4-beta-glucanase C) (cellulase C) [uncultured bacterium contig00078]
MANTGRMRGLNMGGWLSQIDAIQEKDPEKFPGIDRHMETFIGEADFANVKKWGFDHVRVPVDSYLFFTENEEEPVESRLIHLDRAAELAKQNCLKLILDLHECPGHDFSDAAKVPVQKLFVEGDDTYIKKTEKIWAFLAQRYGENSHVLFETLNEPVAPTAQIWNKIKDRFCRTIRAQAPKSTIITGSNMWNWPSTFSQLTPFEDDNVIYSVHFYEPLLFTHQKAPWINNPEIQEERTYPYDYGDGFVRKYGFAQSAGKWDKDRFLKEFEPVSAFSKKYNAPVICNEFGVYTPVELQSQLRWYDDLLSVLKELGIGFSYWNYKNLDFGIISIGEKLHESLPQYDNPERINHPVLEVLRKY